MVFGVEERNWRLGPKENKSDTLRPGTHKHNTDFYFLSLIQLQASGFSPYIPKSGNKVGKMNVTEIALKIIGLLVINPP